jgi:uncharacterized protein YlxW (UPF0749 family)
MKNGSTVDQQEQYECLNDLVKALQQQRDAAHNAIAHMEAKFAQFRRMSEKNAKAMQKEIADLKKHIAEANVDSDKEVDADGCHDARRAGL